MVLCLNNVVIVALPKSVERGWISGLETESPAVPTGWSDAVAYLVHVYLYIFYSFKIGTYFYISRYFTLAST